MSELLRRILVAMFGIPLLLSMTFLGGWYFFVLIIIISSVSQWEFYRLQEKKGLHPQSISGLMIGILILFFVQTQYWLYAGVFVLLSIMVILADEMFRSHKNVSANIGVTLLGIFYIPFFLATLLFSRTYIDHIMPGQSSTGFILIFILYTVIWVCDTCAYGFGKKFGRHKLYERVSPNKSIEGALAGVAGGVIVMAVVKILGIIQINWLPAVLFGVLVTVVGQVGDLVESWFKRDAGVKDSSSLLPGHGGMLDRFDSIIFVSPVFLLIVIFLLN